MFLRMQKRSLAFLLALVLLLSTFMSTAIIPASAAEADVADVAADTEVADVAADVDTAEESAKNDVADVAADAEVADVAADVDTAEESAKNDVADVAADAEVADEAAAADVSPVGEDNWVSIEGITVPADLSVETESTYSWVYDSAAEALEGNSGSASATSKYFTYLKITNIGDQAGVFSFDYKTLTDYAQAGYGVLLYKKGAKPTYSAAGCDNYQKATEFCGQMSSFKTCDAALLQPGDSVYLASYRQFTNRDPKLWVKNFTFDTEYTQPVITLPESDAGWFASTNNYNAAHVTSLTGEVGKLAGTVYAIPNVTEGYKFDGLYTTPDFQADTKVSPAVSSQSRTFNLFYSKQSVTYYPKFTKQEKSASYHVTYDPKAFDSVSYTLNSSLGYVSGYMTDQQSLQSINKVTEISNGDTVTVYPGDSIKFNYTVKSDYSCPGITVDGGTGNTYYKGSNTTINLTRTKDTVQELEIPTVNIAYYEIEGFTSDVVTVMTRPQYNGNDTIYATNYPWKAENGVLKNGNTRHSEMVDDCSLLKMVAKKSGALVFDFRLNCPEAEDGWWTTYYGIFAIQKLSGSDTDVIFDGSNVRAFDSYYYGDYSKWTTAYIMVDEGDVVGFNYYALNSSGTVLTNDFAELKNVRISSGQKTITYYSTNEEYGRVGDDVLNDGAGEVGDEVTLTAEATGGQFVSWQQKVGDEWVVVSTEPKYTFTIVDVAEYRAMFAPALEGDAVASVNNADFSSLSGAVNCAAKGDTVILLTNYTQTEDLTIPSGVTLLIPYDSAHTLCADSPKHVTSSAAQKLFCKLTLSNAAITFEDKAVLSVASQLYGTNNACYPTGPYGQIDLDANSKITMTGSSILYAWGYITGAGEIEVKDTAAVQEVFQVGDMRGGNASSAVNSLNNRYGIRVFPFSQYYVQNVEARMTVYSNAVEKAFITTQYSWTDTAMIFFGKGGLFVLEDGSSVTKYYDNTRDKLVIEINGDAALNEISVLGQYNSSDYVLPINNMAITQKSGTLTNKFDIQLFPDCVLTIDRGAVINNIGSIYVFDKEDYGKYVYGGDNYIRPLVYSATKAGKSTRTHAKMEDAVINVNGTLTSSGIFATTPRGAAITSSQGNGVVSLTNKDAGILYGVVQNSNTINGYEQVQTAPALLKNADGTYRYSEIRDYDDQSFTYVNGVWITDEDNTFTYIWNDKDGNELQREEGVRENATVSYKGDLTALEYTVGEGEGSKINVCTGWNVAYDTATHTAVLTPRYKEVELLLVKWNDTSGNLIDSALVPYMGIPSHYRPKAVLQYIDSFAGPMSFTGTSITGYGNNSDTGIITAGTTFKASQGKNANKTIFFYQQNFNTSGTVTNTAKNKTVAGASKDTTAISKALNTSYTIPAATLTAPTDYKFTGLGEFLGWYVTDKYGFSYDAENSDIFDYNRSGGALICKSETSGGAYITATEAYQKGLISKLYQPGDTITVSRSLCFFPVYNTEAATVKTYKITYKNYNDAALTPSAARTQTLEQGVRPEFTGTTPVRTSSDSHIRYEFDGWTTVKWTAATENTTYAAATVYAPDALPTVYKALTYYAHFKEIRDDLTVTFKDADGTVLQTETVTYGTVDKVDFTRTYPTKQEGNDVYTAIGWTNGTDTTDTVAYVPVPTDDVVYTPVFSSEPDAKATNTVTWKNGDGAVLQTKQVAYNTIPVYDGDTPSRPITDGVAYTFTGNWLYETIVNGQAKTGVVKAGHAFPKTYADITFTAEYTEQEIFNRHSLTLDGTIGVNFYVLLPDGYDESNTEMDFSWGAAYLGPQRYDTETPNTLNDVKGEAEGSYVKFTLPLAAKELNDTISATLKSGETVIAEETYKGTDYAYQVLSKEEGYFNTEDDPTKDAKLKELVRTLLITAADAQNSFGYNTEDLATYKFGTEDFMNLNTDLTPVDKTTLRELYPADDAFSDITFYGSALNLEDETGYTLYFNINNPAGYSVSQDDVSATTTDIKGDIKSLDLSRDQAVMTYNGNKRVRISMKGLAAAEITNDIKLTYKNQEITVNPGEYILLALEQGSDTLKNTVTALYNYNQAAIAFFGGN